MLIARYIPIAHPVKKLARRAKCGEKLAKKSATFYFGTFWVPAARRRRHVYQAASRDDD